MTGGGVLERGPAEQLDDSGPVLGSLTTGTPEKGDVEQPRLFDRL